MPCFSDTLQPALGFYFREGDVGGVGVYDPGARPSLMPPCTGEEALSVGWRQLPHIVAAGPEMGEKQKTAQCKAPLFCTTVSHLKVLVGHS